ncbi:unnamed protein product [Parnassius mnemosyne]|uniref:CCHC-type domain-containing protein n=1 Tax=Parnassius mnemosyne TaxID=213953 RepID=A0AAV1KA07_9NEOP
MSIGRIPEFDLHKDDWRSYVDRLEQYFVVNKISEDLQVPTLITVMGAECYELLVNLCTPTKPKDKSFLEITNILEKHLQPKPSTLAERYKFRHRKQKSCETIAEYAAILKRMSKSCEFGQWLEESLRDQLVCGILSETIRQRLFAEGTLEYGKAYSLAVNMEAAEKDAAAVEGYGQGESSGSSSTAECQAMAATRRGNGRGRPGRTAPTASRWQRQQGKAADGAQQCAACGGPHGGTKCRFAAYVCRVCNRKGHLRRMCPNLTTYHHVDIGTPKVVESDETDSDEVRIFDIKKLSIEECTPLCISINVHGKDIDMECDTGSAVSCISYKFYKHNFSDLPISKCNVLLRYYTGEIVRPVGVATPLVRYKNTQKKLNLFIIRDGKTVLLGRQWLAELKIQLPVFQYHDVNNVNYKDFDESNFMYRFSEVFADGLGRFSGGRVSIHLRQGARPVFMRARPLAYALREPVERALEQLVRDGVLTPVERSDWATPIVPVLKKDGNIRICADYKLTLNKVLEVNCYPLPRIDDLLSRLHGGERFSKIDLSQAYA